MRHINAGINRNAGDQAAPDWLLSPIQPYAFVLFVVVVVLHLIELVML